ncbi:MAG: KfrB domain-containing protein [Pseudomonadota bacterium]
MTQRLLVMNGQRLLQSERGGEWITSKVDRAGFIKPGIYNLAQAASADKMKDYDGPVLHADREHVFQQVGKTLIKHEVRNFSKVPETGSNTAIRYDGDHALITNSVVLPSRGIRR